MTTGYTCSTICNTGLLLHRTTGYTGLLVTQDYWLHRTIGYTGQLAPLGSKNRSLRQTPWLLGTQDSYNTEPLVTHDYWLHSTIGNTGLLLHRTTGYTWLLVTHDYWLYTSITQDYY